MKNPTLSLQSPKLEQRTRERREQINAQAIKDARMHAEISRPLPRDKSSKPYTGTYTAQWLDVRTEGLQDIQPEAHTAKIRHALAAAQAERAEIKHRITGLEHANRLAKYEQDGNPASGFRGLNRTGLLFGIVCYLAEVAFYSWSFQFIGDSLLFSLLIAIGICMGGVMLARGILDALAKRETLGRKAYIIAGIISAVALASFAGLAMLRAQSMSSEEVTMSGWFFFSISVFFFVATIIICHRYFPKGNDAATDAARTLADGIKSGQRDIERLNERLKAVNDSLASHMEQYTHITSMANHFTERINSLHRETIELYHNANITARKDNATPECFLEPIADLPPAPTIPTIELNLSDK